MKKLTDKVGPRKAEMFLERLLYCAGTIYIYGFITDAERKKVHRRMMKRLQKERAEIQNVGKKKKQLPEGGR